MKASEVRVGSIYNVDFEPVRKGEFDKTHLAVVIKKNRDSQTFVVVPLTSSPTGSGLNKLHIGKIDVLPESLRDKETYAVYDQVRTVNASRFRALKQGNAIIDVLLPTDRLQQLMNCVIIDLFSNLESMVKQDILQNIKDAIICAEVENNLYAVMREKYVDVDKVKREKIQEDVGYLKQYLQEIKCEEEKTIFHLIQKNTEKY